MSKGFIIIADIMPVSHLLPQDPKEDNKPISEQPFRKFAIFNGKLLESFTTHGSNGTHSSGRPQPIADASRLHRMLTNRNEIRTAFWSLVKQEG